MRLACAALIAAGLALTGCGSTPKGKPDPRASAHRKPAPVPTKPARPAETARPSSPYTPPPQAVERRGPGKALSRLAGWEEENHRAALQAVQAGCGVARDALSKAACAKARALGDVDDARAKAFLEATFEAETVGGEGVLTAYFAPKYEARTRPDREFSAPVRPRPSGLVAAAADKPPPIQRRYKELGPKSDPQVDLDDLIDVALQAGRQEIENQEFGDGGEFSYPAYAPRGKIDLARADRATIERAAPDGALAWMKPEDLFYLQIQGSGVLVFPDGRRMKAAYAGDNGQPFVAIARPMVNQGLLRANGASGDAIRGWLAANRGPRADKVMQLNPRYIFFDLRSDDGREPAGAAGVPLPPGHAIAIDPSRHQYGEIYWIDAEAPVLAGSHKVYRRLVMALDTGSAIKGEVRADLYVGSGDAAGLEAGRVRHTLRMMRLRPIDPRSARHEADDPTRGG